MRRKTRWACAVVAGVIGLDAGAALKADWSGPGVSAVVDPQGDDIGGAAMDLLEIAHVFQNGSHYIRMRSLEAPSGSSFGHYLLNFDWRAGGVDAQESYYVADGLAGIDFLFDTRYHQDALMHNLYAWMDETAASKFSSVPLAQAGVTYRTQMDGTQFLQEWEIPSSFWSDELGMIHGGGVTVYGATMNVHPWVGRTFDTTSGLSFQVVPEPTAVSLLLVVSGAVYFVRRRFFS